VENLALYFLWGGLVSSGISAGVYILYASQPYWAGLLVAPRSAVTEAGSVTIARSDSPNLGRSTTLRGAATFSAWTTVVFGALGLIFRTIALDHPPISNLFEFSMAFGFAIALVYALLELRYGTRLLGAFAMPVAFGLFASALAFPSEGQETLVPALHAPTVLTIHVSIMILSYAVLAVSFAAAVMHILQGNKGRRHAWIPSAGRCDELTYQSVLVGFPLLAVGIALGAWWANDAWGRYWGWDPKETAALVTGLIFAVYLHTRGMRQLRGTRGSWIVVGGFVAVLFTYLGVNLWISGLHSYAGV
jgi:cytochrome c-type biogenesis protein CcsB